MKNENIVKEKSFSFALRIVLLYQYLTKEKKEFVLSKQLLRSGTAIGALIRESEYAESPLDFIHKLHIALKEANETAYWIELLHKGGYIDKTGFDSIMQDINELMKLLTAIIITKKKNLSK